MMDVEQVAALGAGPRWLSDGRAMELPYLIRDFAGIGGKIKQRPEDFFVQELPLYEPSGEGEHLYVEIQKVKLSTFEAVNRLARACGVSPHDIGYAGMKDTFAVTRQIFSIRGVDEQRLANVELPGMQVLWAMRHGNKLRLGHLAANRFAIRIRDVQPTDVVRLRPVFARLEKTGIPNYFGPQRFGRRGDNAILGEALVRGDDQRLLDQLLGAPQAAVDDEQSLEARMAYVEGDFEKSLSLWPRHCGLERNVLSRLMKNGPQAAVRSIDRRIRELWVTALQSALFNEVVAERIETLDRLLDGDVAMKHANGACFAVEDPAKEQPRVDAWEISPTGPMLGYRMMAATGQAGAIEQAVFDRHQLRPESFSGDTGARARGERRPLRIRPTDCQLSAGVDEHGAHITIAFTLPPGAFATTLLREIMRNDPAE